MFNLPTGIERETNLRVGMERLAKKLATSLVAALSYPLMSERRTTPAFDTESTLGAAKYAST